MAVLVSILLYLGAMFWAFVFGFTAAKGSGNEALFVLAIAVSLFLCAAVVQVSA